MISFSVIKRFLSGNRARRRHVEADASGLTDIGSGKRTHLSWQDVEWIYGVQLDKITFDENYLVIEGPTGLISVSELDEEFPAVVRQIRDKFPEVPEDWRASLEGTETTRVDLWPRGGRSQ